MKALLLTAISGFFVFSAGLCQSDNTITTGERSLADRFYPNIKKRHNGWKYVFDSRDFGKSRVGLSSFTDNVSRGQITFGPEVIYLKEIKEKLFGNIKKDAGYSNGADGNLSGVKFTYGYNDATRQFVIIYEPVYFSPVKGKEYKIKTLQYPVAFVSDNSNNGNLARLTQDSKPFSISDTSMLINNYRGGRVLIDGKPFQEGATIDVGDIKCCYMTLQQIELMCSATKRKNDITGSIENDMVAFCWVADKNAGSFGRWYTGGKSSNNNKLHIVVYYTSVNDFQKQGGVQQYQPHDNEEGADFSGMNPPYAGENIMIGN